MTGAGLGFCTATGGLDGREIAVGVFVAIGFLILGSGVGVLVGKGTLFEIGFLTVTGFCIVGVGVVFISGEGVFEAGDAVLVVFVTLTSMLTHLPSKLLPLVSPLGHISLVNTFPAENQAFPASGAPALLFPPLPPPLLALPPPHEIGGVNQVAVTIT